MSLLVLALVSVALVSEAAAEDSRLERARQMRDEILAKRRDAPPTRPAPAREDPYEAAMTAARERLATIDAQIEEKRRRSEGQAAPREQLAARGEELQAATTRLEGENRARVEAIYRSAKLGAGAAGWHPDPARSARLSRYLASVAAVQDRRLEVIEIEHGSVIAALDRARAEDAAAAVELRVLAADRNEAVARLDQVLAEGGHGPASGSEIVAAYESGEHNGDELVASDDGAYGAPIADDGSDASDDGADASDEEIDATNDEGEEIDEAVDLKAIADELAASEAAAAEAVDRENRKAAAETSSADDAAPAADDKLDASARQVELALAELAAKTAMARATAKQADVANDKAGATAVAPKAVASASAASQGSGATGQPGSPGAAMPASPATATPGVPVAGAPAGAESVAPGATAARTPETPPGSAPAAPGADTAAPAGADAPSVKPRGLLSRIFGNDKDSDAFSASRGTLPPPVAGKVVANYGQQHKSGATYRGVILRAGHSEPIKAVAAGKVSFAGNVPGLGNTVIVSHGGRYHTVYARLGAVNVKEGQSIKPGSELGELPDDNADMHFELRDQGKAIDPLPWLKSGIPGAAP